MDTNFSKKVTPGPKNPPLKNPTVWIQLYNFKNSKYREDRHTLTPTKNMNTDSNEPRRNQDAGHTGRSSTNTKYSK